MAADYACGLSGRVSEVLTPISLPVKGCIPPWVRGALYRNGPGVFDLDKADGRKFRFDHWFDGLTVMHKFEVGEGGSVTYRNRHLNTPLEEHTKQHGWNSPGFAQDPCDSLFYRVASSLVGSRKRPVDPDTGLAANENVGVTVGRMQGRLVSRTDANALVEVDPEDLKPRPMTSYSASMPELKGFLSAAHAQYDPIAGETYNYVLDFPRGAGLYRIFCVPDAHAGEANASSSAGQQPAAGEAGSSSSGGADAHASTNAGAGMGHVLANVPADAAYIHSFGLTQRYVILLVWPALFSPLKLAAGYSLLTSMHWSGSKKVKAYVVDRQKDGPGWIATYELDPFYCFHTVNAFDEGDDIVIDLITYADLGVLEELKLDNLRNPDRRRTFGGAPATLQRILLPNVPAAAAAGPKAASAGTVSTLSDALEYELPRINRGLQFKPYRWMYAIAVKTGVSPWVDRLAKVDVTTGSALEWAEPGCYPGEPIFLPEPGADPRTEEDRGVLLSVVLHGPSQRSFLLVLDAQSMKELARAEVPQVVPFGFHGNFYGPGGTNLTDMN